MEKKELIESETEKTLNSLDNLSRAEVNPYLYGKVINRLEDKGYEGKRFNFKLAISIVVVCILVNLGTYFFALQNSSSSEYEREVKLQTIGSEYSFTNNYYY